MRLHAKVFTIMLMLLLITISATLSVGYIEKSNYEINSTLGFPPEIEWNITFGNNITSELACGIIPLDDGGYVLVGNTFYYDEWENYTWIMKVGPNGEPIWNKTYREPSAAISFAQADTGGYIICGMKNPDSIWLLSMDEEGNELWNKTYIPRGIPYGIYQTQDGYLILGEFLSFDDHVAGILKVDVNGTFLWYKEYDGFCYSVAESNDGGFFLVGSDYDDAMIIKIDEDGNQQWKRLYGDIGLKKNFVSIEKIKDGNWIITGGVYHPTKVVFDILFVKVNEFGDILLDKTIDGPYDSEIGFDIEQTFDEGYIISGILHGPIPGGRISLLKIDSEGNKCWEKIIDGYSTYPLFFDNIVHQTIDGGYILIGMTRISSIPKTYPDVFVTKFTSEDFNSPNIQILKPEDGLYLQNKKILELKSSVVFGPINIKCEVTDEETGVESVQIYLNDELKTIRENPPYSFLWDEQVFGQFKIKIVAYDYAENDYSIEKNVWKFF